MFLSISLPARRDSRELYCGQNKFWQHLDGMTQVSKKLINECESRVEVQFVLKQQSVQVAHWSCWHVFRGCVKIFDLRASCGTKRFSVWALTKTARGQRWGVHKDPIFILNTHAGFFPISLILLVFLSFNEALFFAETIGSHLQVVQGQGNWGWLGWLCPGTSGLVPRAERRIRCILRSMRNFSPIK